MEDNYIGIHKNRRSGRDAYRVRFTHNKKLYIFGHYKTRKETAMAHDLFVIKMGMDRKTNFLKRKEND
jgi:hypothetical protein